MNSNKEWGPNAWTFLHYITFNYPENPTAEEQQQVETFFNSLQYLLPCEECKENFKKEMELFPIDTRSKYYLSNWLVNVHNSVNIRLKKPLFSYVQAQKKYDTSCLQCKNKNFKSIHDSSNNSSNLRNGLFVLSVLTIIFVIVMFYLFYKKIRK